MSNLAPLSEAGVRERWIAALDGTRLYVRDYGDPLASGTALLCLAGLTRNSKDFETLAERQSVVRRVVCPDYRGRGRSERSADWRAYRPETTLDDMVAVITALNLHPVVVCGTSFGGLLAMALAARAPSLLAGVILNDVGPEVDSEGMARIWDYIGRDRPQDDWAGAVAEVKAFDQQLGTKDEAGWRRFAEATYRQGPDGKLHFDWDVTLVRAFGDGTPNRDLWQLFQGLADLPVVALRGARSDVLSESTFSKMVALKPDLIQVTVRDVGHTPSLDEPEAEEAIDDLLTRVDERRSD